MMDLRINNNIFKKRIVINFQEKHYMNSLQNN